MQNLNLDIPAFLAGVWQTKPLLIRQGINGFIDPIDEHDLAGLAQEPEIDSRIVSLHNNKWSVSQGPFEDFSPLCQGKWTLMVQGVDRWVDEVSQLAKHFNFIPNWRFDDVMISYSVPGAGVGAHVDQYDVFLLQGKGERHWQVGKPENLVTTSPHKNLQQVQPFEPIIDAILEPGDILYIPPGWPHCGTTLKECITYSMGFRAPNARDLLQPINDGLFNNDELSRYTDAQMPLHASEFEVSTDELKKLTELVQSSLHSEHWQRALLLHLSDQQLPTEPPLDLYTKEYVTHALKSGKQLRSIPACRPITQSTFKDEIFINGQSYRVNSNLKPFALSCFSLEQKYSRVLSDKEHIYIVDFITQCLNDGLLYFT